MIDSTRLPALPLIANDPYFSIWMPADTFTEADSTHWAGEKKPLTGEMIVDGKTFRFLGTGDAPAMETKRVCVTPTRTLSVLEAAGVELTCSFVTPALPDDLDVLSTPITFFEVSLRALDGAEHEASVQLRVSDRMTFNGDVHPAMTADDFRMEGMNIVYIGQKQQKVLSHSGDHITIDWGYLYLASDEDTHISGDALEFLWRTKVGKKAVHAYAMLAYDDIASIDYFGVYCRAWYARGGASIVDALTDFHARHDALIAACDALDARVLADAQRVGGDNYELIVSAAWRHTFAAHKLIATPAGEMAFLSKENDSNGCIGTVDVSYPSTPLFLKYCPELVNALCRPVLKFANLPVWEEDFAPHDVGRYPHATGQVYALKNRGCKNGEVYPPYYQYPAGRGIYDIKYQMPVEECGNMLVMLAAAVHFGADAALAQKYADTLARWVMYLDRFGEDPGEQLCTDDFAGHLAHNINLSAKAVVGIACYARLLERFGREKEAKNWQARAQELAKSWQRRAANGDSTYLTFDKIGWSQKYNLVWDEIMGLGLLPEEFYRSETNSYPARMNRYGLPLDSRADYTKSDWLVWSAAMAPDRATFDALIAPLADYLRESRTRVAFSDWYDTKTGDTVHFIARSVQGGVFMPLLKK